MARRTDQPTVDLTDEAEQARAAASHPHHFADDLDTEEEGVVELLAVLASLG